MFVRVCVGGVVCRREDDKTLTPEEKLERSRVRNRDHSRKSRQRKKALVEGMKKQVPGGGGGGGEMRGTMHDELIHSRWIFIPRRVQLSSRRSSIFIDVFLLLIELLYYYCITNNNTMRFSTLNVGIRASDLQL